MAINISKQLIYVLPPEAVKVKILSELKLKL